LPELTTQPGYRGLVPGFDIRLWGLTSHANTLGAVASIFLVLEVAEPSSRKWVRNCILAAATLALIMTQSKTSILAAVLGLLTITIWHLVVFLQETNRSSVKNNNLLGIFFVTLLISPPVILGGWLLFADSSLIIAIEREFDPIAVGHLSTASGRDLVWQLAVKSGLESPVFGWGAGFWEKIRLMPGMSGAAHAHNLFLQVFTRSGFVGLTALAIFLYFLLRYSIRSAKNTRGGGAALMVLFLTRAIFEVPIQPNAILGGEFFAMMGFFIYTISRGAKPIIKTQEIEPVFPSFVKIPISK
jgi:exopolysaccharide production protein ExoQ